MLDSVNDWTIDRAIIESAPPVSQVDIAADGDSISLVVAGVGLVKVSRNGCTVSATTSAAQDSLVALAGNWAWGQWLGINGTFSFHGVTLARDGVGLALIGAPRSGTSLTALAMSRDGWQVIADGVCPLQSDANGISALPGRQALEVDALVTQMFPPAGSFEDAETPRKRSLVSTASADATPIQHIIELVTTNIRTDGVVVPADTEESRPASRLQENSIVGKALQAASSTLGAQLHDFCEQVVSVVPFDVALVPYGSPARPYSPMDIANLVGAYLEAAPGRSQTGATR